MGTAETIAALTEFEGRGAGTNSERRAALWLADQLRSARREATIETFWCRPNWALAHAWHVALAVAGSLVSVSSPKLGGALILVALLSLLLDGLTGRSLGRRLSREHASQNVVSRRTDDRAPITLIVTANYDAGRMGIVYRPSLRRIPARLRNAARGRVPGWLAWLAIAFAWLLAIAIVRDGGTSGTAIGAIGLIPTAALVLGLALLLELAVARHGPGASDNASGVAVAVALASALDAAPPRNLKVELVLQGAGDGAMTGLGRYLRARRPESTSANTVVLGIASCGGGSPRWWTSDGALIPLRFAPRLQRIAASAIGDATEHAATAHGGRGTSPAYPARFAGLPAITIGCLDDDGLAPRSHDPKDTPDAIDRTSTDTLLELALTLVDAIDADLARTASDTPTASPAAA